MLIGGTIIRNGTKNKYFSNWLFQATSHFDKWIIIDDCSDDGTVKEIESFASNVDCDIQVFSMKEPTFKTNENTIRNKLWETIRQVAMEGDWVMILDSDEIPEKAFREKVNEVMLNNKIGVVTLKKLEVWDEEGNYRIDGLWSNFFDRLFHYENKEWGYYGEGFHHPQIPKYAFECNIRLPSDIKIEHYSYYTPELRQSKYDFMMNNPQQKKDITYHHLQTVNDVPVLRSLTFKPKVVVNIICNNLYCLQPEIEKVLSTTIPDIVSVRFLVSGCSYKVIQQITDLDVKCCDKVYFDVINYLEEHERNKYFNRWQKLCQEAVNKCEDDFDYMIFIDGSVKLTKGLLEQTICLDKKIAMSRVDYKVLAFDREIINALSGHFDKFNDNVSLLRYLLQNKQQVWSICYGSPFLFV